MTDTLFDKDNVDNLTLNNLDYRWVDECSNSKMLKRGLALLKEDGGHFPELEKYIHEKLIKIDKKYAYII